MVVARGREAELAARWLAGAWRGATLRSEDGECYRVIFEGRRGGGAGPDFRDAVLLRDDGTLCYGDIELHLRPSGWYAHGHGRDPRYNRLALHVVVSRSARDSERTPLASGRSAPLVVLGEWQPAPTDGISPRWPCAEGSDRGMQTSPPPPSLTGRGAAPQAGHLLGKGSRRVNVSANGTGRWAAILHAAGIERFEEHARRLDAELHAAEQCSVGATSAWDAANRVLWLALAEALGYGRDRALLRHLGMSLLDAHTPADRHAWPAIERKRAAGLLVWHERWERYGGPWPALEQRLSLGELQAAIQSLREALRVSESGAISARRADIVAVNVLLPFATIIAARKGDMALDRRARALYATWPGLPSNQIVREMARTLGLARLPRGALAQQGLHALWEGYCREKDCERCPCNPASADGFGSTGQAPFQSPALDACVVSARSSRAIASSRRSSGTVSEMRT